ncbi:type II toxin-antitoxin system RelE/ParE family toxin [Candidatus Peregrinibacteria bacterium]|nr:type II toxin-antitoxin system RelE/ParE family toxin [Candidatus Peregrinibacteria bacterium]
MIKTFKCKETEGIFERLASLKLPRDIQKAALRKLNIIHAAVSINDLRVPPGNRLEQLSGKRRGQYSIRVNEQWGICFKWEENNAYDVEIIDYH